MPERHGCTWRLWRTDDGRFRDVLDISEARGVIIAAGARANPAVQPPVISAVQVHDHELETLLVALLKAANSDRRIFARPRQ